MDVAYYCPQIGIITIDMCDKYYPQTVNSSDATLVQHLTARMAVMLISPTYFFQHWWGSNLYPSARMAGTLTDWAIRSHIKITYYIIPNKIIQFLQNEEIFI